LSPHLPFEIVITQTNERLFAARMSTTDVLRDGRALDGANRVAVRTSVGMVEQVRHDVMSYHCHLVAAVAADFASVDEDAIRRALPI